MLDALARVADRLIALREYRGERQRRIYARLVEPLFQDLIAIHDDYLKMWITISGILEPLRFSVVGDRTAIIGAATDYLLAARSNTEAARRKAQSLATEIGENPKTPNDVRRFADAIVSYFFLLDGLLQMPDLRHRDSLTFDWLRFLENLSKARSDAEIGQYVKGMTDWMSDHLGSRWKWICDANAALRASAELAD